MKKPIKNIPWFGFGFSVLEDKNMDPNVILLGPPPEFVIDPDTGKLRFKKIKPNQVIKIILK